jgi:hypothetical protein
MINCKKPCFKFKQEKLEQDLLLEQHFQSTSQSGSTLCSLFTVIDFTLSIHHSVSMSDKLFGPCHILSSFSS